MVATKKKPNSAISEIKTLRAKLAHLEKKYTQVALEKNFLDRAMKDLNFHDNAHDGVVYTDAADNIVYANPYFLGMMGVKDKTEILDQPFPDYMWNNAREADRLFNDIKSDGFVREREMALYNREGQPVFAMCSGVVSKDKDGNILGTEIMFCNITSKRSFQAELVEQHALLDTVLQSTPDPILVLNSALDIKRSNPAAQKILDLTGNSEDRNIITILAKTCFPKDWKRNSLARTVLTLKFGSKRGISTCIPRRSSQTKADGYACFTISLCASTRRKCFSTTHSMMY